MIGLVPKFTLVQITQLIYEPGHMDFISSRLDLIIDAKECVSPRQLDRMINSMRRNPSRFFRSKTYEAHRESERL